MTRFSTYLLAALIAGMIPATAHEYQVGSLTIAHPWTRATPPGATVGGGYAKIINHGTMPDRLLGGSFAAAERVLIHQMKMDGSVMTMRVLEQGVEIAPGATAEFGPESLHLMFEGLKEPLVKGKRVKGTFLFEKAGTVVVEYVVEGLGTRSTAPESPGSSHTH